MRNSNIRIARKQKSLFNRIKNHLRYEKRLLVEDVCDRLHADIDWVLDQVKALERMGRLSRRNRTRQITIPAPVDGDPVFLPLYIDQIEPLYEEEFRQAS